jgi:hypothetical protein
MLKVADSYSETLQNLADEFIDVTGKQQFTVKELAVWSIRTERWEAPADLVLRKCCEDFSRALRDQHITDALGNSVRAKHVARLRSGDKQLYLWADIRNATHNHIETSFDQRRKQIVGDCRQLNRDNKYYQSIHPDRPKIQLVFDFRDDVDEGEFSGEYPPRKPR